MKTKDTESEILKAAEQEFMLKGLMGQRLLRSRMQLA